MNIEDHGWGKSVVNNLSDELRKEFVGIKGFSVQNLWNMRQFYLEYYENEKLQPLVGEISWTKNVVIFQKSKDVLEREFYIKSVIKFGWTKDLLINHLESKSYEKFLLNQTNFNKTLPEEQKYQAKFAVKDEYNFDFLELSDNYNEYELEIGLINKIREFLSVLNDTVKLPEENASIGIIICKDKKRTTVEYALKDNTQPIGIATYRLSKELPTSLQKYLPTASEIENSLMEYLKVLDVK